MNANYDPYLLWDYAAKKDWLARSDESKWLGLIGHLPKKDLELLSDFWSGLIHIPSTYLDKDGNVYFTATLDAEFLRDELQSPSNEKLQDLLKACESSFATTPNTHRNVNADGKREAKDKRKADGEGEAKPRGLVCGVIDFGCAYLHPQFRTNEVNSMKTRIHSIWDQGATSESNGKDAGWTDCDMGYGSVLKSGEIDNAITRNSNGSSKGYGDGGSNYLRDPNTGSIYSKTHGTHVLGLAAGLTSPFQPTDTVLKAPAAGVEEQYPEIIFVQLPLDKYKSTQRGSLGRFILDGVRYILDNCKDEDNIVINISYGSTTGPHDGSSMLERALDGLVGERKGKLSIVLSAGNSHLEDCHLTTNVADKPARFKIQLPTKSASETFVEFWYEITGDKTMKVSAFESNIKFDDGNQMQLEAGENGDVPGIPGARIYHTKVCPNTDAQKALILLALPPTAQMNRETSVVVEFAADRNLNKRNIVVQGWIELDASAATREDNARFIGIPASIKSVAFGESQETTLEDHVRSHWNTMSGFATGKKTYKCGARRYNQEEALPYSSRKFRPNGEQHFVLAAAEESAVLTGILGPSVDPDNFWRMNGTSVSAAMCSRRLLQQKQNERAKPPPEDNHLEDLLWVDQVPEQQ